MRSLNQRLLNVKSWYLSVCVQREQEVHEVSWYLNVCACIEGAQSTEGKRTGNCSDACICFLFPFYCINASNYQES